MSEPFVLMLIVIVVVAMLATVVLINGGSFSTRFKLKPTSVVAEVDAQNLQPAPPNPVGPPDKNDAAHRQAA